MNFVSLESRNVNCFTKSYGGRYFKGTGSFLVTRFPEWLPYVERIQSLCCQAGDLSGMESVDPEMEIVVERLKALSPEKCHEEGRKVLFGLLQKMKPRYFRPEEVAKIHAFPDSFRFPEGIALKRKYALLGNSLHVTVVAYLIRFLLDPNS